jgi:type II secretory pathway component GspD/PulD (secretin)
VRAFHFAELHRELSANFLQPLTGKPASCRRSIAMSRLIAALIVCSCCVLFAFAQETPRSSTTPVERRVMEAGDVPFLVTEVDGKPAWKLRGQVEISLADLVSAWVRATGIPVPVAPRSLVYVASYEAPLSGVTLTGEAITDFVSDMLAQVRLVLVGFSSGRVQIVSSAEAGTLAQVVNRAELDKAPSSEWVTYCVMLRYADPNSVRGALQALVSRNGGMVNPVMGSNALLITDRADRVRQMAKLSDTLDSAGQGERTLEKYDLPEGLDPVGAMTAVAALLKPSTKYAPDIDVSVVPGKGRLLVRANSSQHIEVKRAIELMK